jgi:BCD family chlorophyll transporter-like MFS transporter
MNWRRVLQLALVHAGVTITVVPVTSTLNRIMIADMGLSAFFVSVLVALPYLLSPLQVLIGAWADRNPVWGQHRSPWIVLGGLMAAFGSYFTAHTVYWMQAEFIPGVSAAIGAFLVWGVGVNIASVSYLSLVSDLTADQPHWRSRAVSTMWTTMIVFIILTSITLAQLLDPYTEETLYTAFGVVWAAACCFVLVGAAGVEPRATGRLVQHSADNPVLAFRLLAQNPTARRFFVFMLLVLISIYGQDVVLEPFGAEVLGMPVSQTARLTSIWGFGLLITLLLGVPWIRRYGKKPSVNLGALWAAVAFCCVIAAGLLHSVPLFLASVFLVGLGCGLLTIASLSLMLDMTIPQAVGLYMGAWGVANFVGRALGTIASGLLRDTVYAISGSPLAGYVAVFALEAVGMVLAIWVLRSITVEAFHRDAEMRTADLLALAGD